MQHNAYPSIITLSKYKALIDKYVAIVSADKVDITLNDREVSV